MKKIVFTVILLCTAASGVLAAPKDSKKAQPKPPSALDKYIEQASQPETTTGPMVPPGRCGHPRHGSRIWQRISARGASMTSSRSRFRKAHRR